MSTVKRCARAPDGGLHGIRKPEVSSRPIFRIELLEEEISLDAFPVKSFDVNRVHGVRNRFRELIQSRRDFSEISIAHFEERAEFSTF